MRGRAQHITSVVTVVLICKILDTIKLMQIIIYIYMCVCVCVYISLLTSDLQILCTASADGTIKLWALSDASCVMTFQGHDASVLKVAFLSRGMQLLSVLESV